MRLHTVRYAFCIMFGFLQGPRALGCFWRYGMKDLPGIGPRPHAHVDVAPQNRCSKNHPAGDIVGYYLRLFEHICWIVTIPGPGWGPVYKTQH